MYINQANVEHREDTLWWLVLPVLKGVKWTAEGKNWIFLQNNETCDLQ